MITKGRILQTIEQLPDDVTVDQVIEKLYLLNKIETGIQQADAGDVMDHEEFKKQLAGDEQ